MSSGRESPSIEVSALDIFVVLAGRRRFLATATILSTAAALLLAFLLPLTYTATTTILPPQQGSSFSSTLLSQMGGLGAMAGLSGLGGMKSQTDLYVGLLKSKTVEDAMVKHFDLASEYRQSRSSDLRKTLEGHVTVDGSGKDGLIRVSVQDRSPERAAELANGYVAQYRQLSASLAIGEAAQRRTFLEQQLQQTKTNLIAAEEQLKQTEQTTGMIQLDSQARALIESAGALRAQVAAKEVQVQSMRTYAGSGNVDLLQAEQGLSTLRTQLARLGGSEGTTRDLIVPKGQLPQAGLDYVRKVREVKYNEAIFEILARQYEAAKLDEAKEGSMIQVVDPATIPDRKSGPPRLLIGLAGLLLGFFGAAIWLLCTKLLRHLHTLPEYGGSLDEAQVPAARTVSQTAVASNI